jgi:NCAIR mutase (PurE)-related protein
MAIKTAKVKIGEIEIELKELSFKDQIDIQEMQTNQSSALKELVRRSIKSPEPTDELLGSLSSKEGMELMEKVNELNGWKKEGDFLSQK